MPSSSFFVHRARCCIEDWTQLSAKKAKPLQQQMPWQACGSKRPRACLGPSGALNVTRALLGAALTPTQGDWERDFVLIRVIWRRKTDVFRTHIYLHSGQDKTSVIVGKRTISCPQGYTHQNKSSQQTAPHSQELCGQGQRPEYVMLMRPVSQHALRQRQMEKDVCLLSLSVDHLVSGGDTRLTHLTPSVLSFCRGGVRSIRARAEPWIAAPCCR